MRTLTHELGVHSSAPKTDVLPHDAVRRGHRLQGAFPVVRGNVVLVVVVPHAIDADILQRAAALVPPIETRARREVDVAPLTAFAAARAPKSSNASGLSDWIHEESIVLRQARIGGVVVENIRLHVGEQSHPTGVAFFCERPRVGEATSIPGEDVSRLGLRLRDGVSRAHLERRHRDVVLLAALDETQDGVRSGRIVFHAVFHTASHVSHHVPRDEEREAD